MSLTIIDNLFDHIKKRENVIKYRYEPWKRKPENTEWTRHHHFKEIQSDFAKEITSYGFSPYIHQTCEVQQQNKDIMKFHHKKIQSGLLNYVKKKNVVISTAHSQKDMLMNRQGRSSIAKQKDEFLSKAFKTLRSQGKDPLVSNLPKERNEGYDAFNDYDEQNRSNSSFSSNPLVPQYSACNNNKQNKGRNGLGLGLGLGLGQSNSDVLMTKPQTSRLNLYPMNSRNNNDLIRLIKKEEEDESTKRNHRTLTSTMNKVNKLLLELNNNLPKSKEDWHNLLLPKPISSKLFIKRLSIHTYSQTQRSNIDELLNKNMFINKNQYIDRKRLIAEKYPGSLFDRLHPIRKNNNTPMKPNKKKLPNKINKLRQKPLEVL